MNQVSTNANIFKQIMSQYPTGVTIVTTLDGEGKAAGLTVNSFASVSLDPLLVLWSIDKRVSSLAQFLNAEKFAIHTLASDQGDACWAFAGKDEDRFSKVNWRVSENGLPIIDGTLGTMECKMVQQIDAGDHYILLGQVIDLAVQEKDPLLFFNRNIGSIPANWPQG